jgi:hypothetical protein
MLSSKTATKLAVNMTIKKTAKTERNRAVSILYIAALKGLPVLFVTGSVEPQVSMFGFSFFLL